MQWPEVDFVQWKDLNRQAGLSVEFWCSGERGPQEPVSFQGISSRLRGLCCRLCSWDQALAFPRADPEEEAGRKKRGQDSCVLSLKEPRGRRRTGEERGRGLASGLEEQGLLFKGRQGQSFPRRLFQKVPRGVPHPASWCCLSEKGQHVPPHCWRSNSPRKTGDGHGAGETEEGNFLPFPTTKLDVGGDFFWKKIFNLLLIGGYGGDFLQDKKRKSWRRKLDLYLTPYTKINSNWTKDLNMVQTTRYKMNNLQGDIVQHREYRQYFIIILNGV